MRRPAIFRLVYATAVLTLAAPANAQMPPPAPVVVTPLVSRRVNVEQTFVGTVMPSKRAVIGSAVDGRVVEFPLNEGQRVGKGETLAQLLTATIKLEHKAAEAELELRRQELAELENGTRPEELEQAKARMLAAEAMLVYLSARRDRAVSLYEQGGATSIEVRDEAISAATAGQQRVLEAQAAHRQAVAGPRVELLAQARARVARQQAIVDQLADQIKKYTISSRFDGYLITEHTEIGQWVKRGDPVAEVVALDIVEVVAYVVEQHVPFIQMGAKVTVEIPALPNRTFPGEVAYIVPQADVRARTFPVKIRVVNEISDNGPLLRAGMYARVSLPTEKTTEAMLVPKDALVLGGRQPSVYVVDRDSDGKLSARPVPVETGVSSGNLIQVRGPLTVGQPIVVRGNERLRPGQAVNIVGTIEAEQLEAKSVNNETPPATPTNR